MNIETVLSFLKTLTSLGDILKNYQTAKLQKDERYRSAVLAIATAADETRAYLADSEQRKNADRSKEIHLSELWRRASVGLMEFDGQLAERCGFKAEYWSDPSDWRRKDIAHAQILLKDISQEVHRLIDKPQK